MDELSRRGHLCPRTLILTGLVSKYLYFYSSTRRDVFTIVSIYCPHIWGTLQYYLTGHSGIWNKESPPSPVLSSVQFTERESRFLHESMWVPGVHTRKLVTQCVAARQYFASATIPLPMVVFELGLLAL